MHVRQDFAMQYWLMKSEPDVFSWDDLVKKTRTEKHGAEWDGVRSHQAQNNMKAMRKGDLSFFYHSNIGLEIVGIMEIVEEAGPDSTDEGGKWVSVHVAAQKKLAKPVTLKAMKADSALQNMIALRQSRLSVAPVSAAEFAHILELAGE
jgi:predicted RNA-binding protein with PUA-like domain